MEAPLILLSFQNIDRIPRYREYFSFIYTVDWKGIQIELINKLY